MQGTKSVTRETGRPWARALHRAVDRIDHAYRPRIARIAPLERAWIRVLDGVVAQQSDRVVLRRSILPALARADLGRILFVGVRGYTAGYERYFRNGRTEYWTSDIDPEAARYGAPGRHRVADLVAIDAEFPAGFFDAVLVNGVLGWGVDDPESVRRAIHAMAHILRPGGTMLIGWNIGRIPDPDTIDAIVALFEPASFAGLPVRTTFADGNHAYAWYRLRS